jgi:hypothetical protein
MEHEWHVAGRELLRSFRGASLHAFLWELGAVFSPYFPPVDTYPVGPETSRDRSVRGSFDPVRRRLWLASDVAADLNRLVARLPLDDHFPADAADGALIGALRTAAHEHLHSVSPILRDPLGPESYRGRDSPGHFLEEGLVEHFARRCVRAWLHGGMDPRRFTPAEWGVLRATLAPLRWEDRAIEWFAATFGREAAWYVWEGTNGPERAGRVEAYLQPWIRKRLIEYHVPSYRVDGWLAANVHSLWKVVLVERVFQLFADLRSPAVVVRELRLRFGL